MTEFVAVFFGLLAGFLMGWRFGLEDAERLRKGKP